MSCEQNELAKALSCPERKTFRTASVFAHAASGLVWTDERRGSRADSIHTARSTSSTGNLLGAARVHGVSSAMTLSNPYTRMLESKDKKKDIVHETDWHTAESTVVYYIWQV